MADELADAGIDVQLLSINKISAETGVSSFSPDMVLPMVQDTTDLGLWTEWEADWRDVYIVDEDNVHVATYNLTGNSLAVTENYEELKSMFITEASD
jgi:hypothetical protein